MKKALLVAFFLVFALSVSCSPKNAPESEQETIITEFTRPTSVLTTVSIEKDITGQNEQYNTYTKFDHYINEAIDKKKNNNSFGNYMDVTNKLSDIEILVEEKYLEKISAEELGWSIYTHVSHKDQFYIFEVYLGKLEEVKADNANEADADEAPQQMQVYAKVDVTEEGKIYLSTAGNEKQLIAKIKPLVMKLKPAE